MELQQADFWCWAAVASSVARHYAPASAWTQCKVASAMLGGFDCCLNAHSPVCNQMARLDIALTRTGNLAPNGARSGPATPEQLLEQIGRLSPARVVGCGIRWANDPHGGHFVVVHGLSIDSNGVLWVAVADPKFGSSAHPYNTFANSYLGIGQWVFSYNTEP
jgi:hypothetical protein